MVQIPRDRDQGGSRTPVTPPERPTQPERPSTAPVRKRTPDAESPPHGVGDGEDD
jgi:hypothetical protein